MVITMGNVPEDAFWEAMHERLQPILATVRCAMRALAQGSAWSCHSCGAAQSQIIDVLRGLAPVYS